MNEIQIQAKGDKFISYELLEKDKVSTEEDVEVREGVEITYDGRKIEKSLGADVVVNFTLNLDLATIGIAAFYLYEKFSNSNADLIIDGEEIEDLSKEKIEEVLQEMVQENE